MDHTEFMNQVEILVGTSKGYLAKCFTDEVIQRWLAENQWIFDQNLPCKQCEHMKRIAKTNEEQCREKIFQGATCYRTVLREVFAPFLRNALEGKYPPIEDSSKMIHRNLPKETNPTAGLSLIGAILHEIGGMYLKMRDEPPYNLE